MNGGSLGSTPMTLVDFAWRGVRAVGLLMPWFALEDGEGFGGAGSLPVILLVVGFLMFVLGYALRDVLGRRKQRADAARKAAQARPSGGK